MKVAAIVSFALLLLFTVSVQAGENLFKNADFSLINEKSGAPEFWKIRNAFTMEKGLNDANAVAMNVQDSGAGSCSNVLSFTASDTGEGRYRICADMKMSKAVKVFQILAYYRGEDGKNVYIAKKLRVEDFPEPGTWLRFENELVIPAVSVPVTFCFEIRDDVAGAKVWISSPELVKSDKTGN